MSLFSRAHDIVAARASKALDSAENPNEMLDYSYEQILEHITKVCQALVDIAASRKRIELQEQQLQQSIAHLNDQAQAALAQGKEDLAREALSRKAAAQQQMDGMEPQHQELTEQEQKLEQTLSQLQQRVSSFRSQKEVLKAQYTAAQASASVNEEAAGISGLHARRHEAELVELSEEEAAELLAELGLGEPGLAQLARAGFAALGLSTFLTAGPKESRAWTIPAGATAPEAAGVIHTDFQRGFIKAEIVSFDDLMAAGSIAAARAAGKARIEGKDYVMRDGDVVEFRFNL